MNSQEHVPALRLDQQIPPSKTRTLGSGKSHRGLGAHTSKTLGSSLLGLVLVPYKQQTVESSKESHHSAPLMLASRVEQSPFPVCGSYKKPVNKNQALGLIRGLRVPLGTMPSCTPMHPAQNRCGVLSLLSKGTVVINKFIKNQN